MIIIVSHNRGGIIDYLVKGTGKESGRDFWDDREVLTGNAKITNNIIDLHPGKGSKYMHMTISFAEDYIEPEKIREVEREIREIYLSAFKDDELDAYSEIHFPKIKAVYDDDGTLLKERKTHIHLVVPTVNLKYGNFENPVGKYEEHIKYFEAIQKYVNMKHGLIEPQAEVKHTKRSEVIQSYIEVNDKIKGRNAGVRERKKQLIEKVIEQNIGFDGIGSVLENSGFEDILVRKEGQNGAYYSALDKETNQRVNFNDKYFMKSFLSKDKSERIEMSGYKRKKQEYKEHKDDEKDDYKNNPEFKQAEELVEEFKDFYSKSIRFAQGEHKKDFYSLKTNEEKRAFVEKLEKEFYDKKEREFNKEFDLDSKRDVEIDRELDDLAEDFDYEKLREEQPKGLISSAETVIKEFLKIFKLSSREVRKLDKSVNKNTLLDVLDKESLLNKEFVKIENDKFVIGNRKLSASELMIKECRYDVDKMEEALIKHQPREQEKSQNNKRDRR